MPAIRVFLVEDEFAVRQGIRENLGWESMGLHFVGQAQDGEVALPMVHELKPDIIITDIKMPFMDGLSFSRSVRKTMPWVKIIILTGFDDFNFAREALNTGVTAYILKPVNAKELSATILKVAADIEQERQFSRNIEALRHKVEESIPLLAERFLNDIVAGTLSAEVINEKAQENGIDILAPFYAVVAVELETSPGDPVEEKRLDQIKLDSIVRRASASGSAIGSIGSLGRIIVIAKGEKSDELEQNVYCLAEKIKSDAKSDIGNRVTIGIGGIVERLTDLPRSYRQAEEAVRSRPLHEGSWIVSGGEPAESMTKERPGGKHKYGDVIRRGKEYIAAHYADENISLKTVAESAGLSSCRFSTVFSQGTGTTFIEYMTQIRISRAMELLKSSALRASEITYAVGYSDPHYFSYIFKKTTGRTPTEFRDA